MIDLLNEVYIDDRYDIPDDIQDNLIDLIDLIYFPGWYIAILTKQNKQLTTNKNSVKYTNQIRKGTTKSNRIRLLRIFDRLTDRLTDQLILSNPLVKLMQLESRTEGINNAIN